MKNFWKERLREILNRSRKVAFVGVGQELRGDDAAGILAVRRLQHTADAQREVRPSAAFFFEAGSLPEASAGPLRRFGPEWVVFIDAADMGEEPGTIGWIDPDQLVATSMSTHTYPMNGYSEYLQTELGCRVVIIGIQPRQMGFDEPVSEEVQNAIDEICITIIGS